MIRRPFARTMGCGLVCVLATTAALSSNAGAQEKSATQPTAVSVATTSPATTRSAATVNSLIGSTSTPPIPPPRGAVVLFDGEKSEGWTTMDGKPCPWKVLEDDSMEIVPGSGNIISKERFEDVQLHVEFWIPKLPADVKGQARGNSGVYLQGRYEIQVLDSYGLPPDKQGCGAIYGRRKPKENACNVPQTWQTYDITFRAPQFDADGKKIKNARVTVIHNGVTIHQDAEIEGPTVAAADQHESPGPAAVMLQDHGNAVRYRNVYSTPVKVAPDKEEPTTQPAEEKSIRKRL
jgi:hypothetical protein